MGNLAIDAKNLGKMYRIGGVQEKYQNIRDVIADTATAPLRRVRDLLRGQAYGAAGLKEEIWALKDVSFEVKHGEVVGIIGRNGAGKSTMLKILSRITEPTTGRAAVYGRVGALLEVGTGFHPELTGRENIYLNGAILGMSRKEINRKFDEIVSFAEIEKFIDTPVKHYSSGMGLRLGFAVAAHLEPEILVVDEVLAVGDLEFQSKCLGKMSDVAVSGRTVMFVSHNMGAIINLCPRSILLEAGQVKSIGATHDVVAEYEKSSSRLHTRSLSERIDRKGSGDIKLTRIDFLDSSGRSVDLAVSGEPVAILLEYIAERDLSQVDFAVGFRTLADVTLFVCMSSHGTGPLSIKRGSGKVCCYIDALPLASGTYSLNLAALRGNTFYDWIGSACALDVETLDFFGNGSTSPKGHSPFLVKSSWLQHA